MKKVIVGVNKFTAAEEQKTPIFKVDDAIRDQQIAKINQIKADRNQAEVSRLLSQLEKDARDGVNLMPAIIECVEAYATLGEIADRMRAVFGEYQS